MRDILFRGRSIKFRGWYEGELINTTGKIPPYMPMILQVSENSDVEAFDVDPDTVGQYSGMKDKNGQRIFEGDIVRARIEGTSAYRGFEWPPMKVTFSRGAFGLVSARGDFAALSAFLHTVTFEIIGNIYETPEEVQHGEMD